jgi:hypothetical protein
MRFDIYHPTGAKDPISGIPERPCDGSDIG